MYFKHVLLNMYAYLFTHTHTHYIITYLILPAIIININKHYINIQSPESNSHNFLRFDANWSWYVIQPRVLASPKK